MLSCLKYLISRSGLPYPLFFAIICAVSYFSGIFLALSIGDVGLFLLDHGFILLCLFGYVSGTFTMLLVDTLNASLTDVEEYAEAGSIEWGDFKRRVEEKVLRNRAYWLVFLFWMTYSFYSIFVSRVTWWRQDYTGQLLMDVYGYLMQGLNGCFLGGIFMTLVSLTLNLAYREILSHRVFSSEIVMPRGKRRLSRFKKLVLIETFAAAVASALAISIWSKAAPYTPIIGSLIMVLPTAVYPHYIFYRILSEAREEKLSLVESRIEELPEGREADIGSLVLLGKLSIELGRVERAKPWLVDLKALLQLIGAAATSQILGLVLKYLLS